MDAIGYSMGFIATKIVIEPEAMDLPFVFLEEMHARNIWENLKPCKFGNVSKFQALWIKDGWEIPPQKKLRTSIEWEIVQVWLQGAKHKMFFLYWV